MNHCAIQNSFTTCEEIRRGSISVSLSIADKRDAVLCPKPQRLIIFNTSISETVQSRRWLMSNQSELCDSKAGNELLDIILSKGVYNMEKTYTQAALSPPFYCGSPPSRVSNPIIQDARFVDEKVTPISPRAVPILPGSTSSPPSSRKATCARVNFGNKPVVRVEGFDCLDRDSRNCGIPTLA